MATERECRIELFPYERRSLETIEREFGVKRDTVVRFAQSLNALRKIYEEACGEEGQEFRSGRTVLLGLINCAHRLLVGGLQALEVGNGVVWSACVRGLMETFGSCVLISESPGTVINHLEHVKAGRLRDAAERGKPGLGADIDRLNKIVHPGPRAIYSGFSMGDREKRIAVLKFGLRKPEPHEGQEGVSVLAALAGLVEEKLEALAKNETVLSAGKVVMVRSGQGRLAGKAMVTETAPTPREP